MSGPCDTSTQILNRLRLCGPGALVRTRLVVTPTQILNRLRPCGGPDSEPAGAPCDTSTQILNRLRLLEDFGLYVIFNL